MNIQVHNHGSLLYAQIDNLYSHQELLNIQKELVYLETVKQFAGDTSPAKKDNVVLKNGGGIFLDEVYLDRNFSTILALNRKIFDRAVTDYLSKHNCFFGHIKHSTRDTTLINFYDTNGEYKSHQDSSIFTAVTFFKIGQFDGGQFAFDDYGVAIEPVEGRVVIFPGCVAHSAKPVIAEQGNFRVTMAQFINYRD